MGKPRGTSNTRASTPTPSKQLFKKKTKGKIMKTKGKKLPIKNKIMKKNKNSIKEELEENEELEELEENEELDVTEDDDIKDNDNMNNDNFKEEVFGKLNFLEMERNIEDIKM